jgi:uncharacterized protein YlxP (DUF503 family)
MHVDRVSLCAHTSMHTYIHSSNLKSTRKVVAPYFNENKRSENKINISVAKVSEREEGGNFQT